MEAQPAFTDTLLPSEEGDVLELDELWSFVNSKAQTLWRWVALCRRTRQIVAWTLGDRSEQSATDWRAALPEAYRGCATRSDLWEAYRAAFPASTHRCCGKEEGETNHVERWFGTLRRGSAAWCEKLTRSPRTPRTTSTPSIFSSPPTISLSNRKQQRGKHYRGYRGVDPGQVFGWSWLDPLVGAAGALVVGQWAYSLIRDTSRVLLDREMDPAALEEIREAIESDGDSRVSDLHLLRVGLNEFAVVASVVTDEPRSPEDYKARLRQHEELAHVTIEVNQCHEHELAHAP